MVVKRLKQGVGGKTNSETWNHLVDTPNKPEEGQVDSEYQLIKKYFFGHERYLIDLVHNEPWSNLIHTWFVKTSNLTKDQEQLNRELLSILNTYPFSRSFDTEKENACNARLEKFFKDNKHNQDLKVVLNLKRGESGLTILHAVSSMAYEDYSERKTKCSYAVELFLKAGADPNIKNDRGETPLHCTTGYHVIASLLKGGADPNAQDIEGRTPLHRTAGADDYNENIGLLLKNKADPNIKDSKGRTPLHYVAKFGLDEFGDHRADLLLENGADPNACDGREKTPLQVAIDNSNYDLEKCFFTSNQKKLRKKLYDILLEVKNYDIRYKNLPRCEDDSGCVVKRTKNLKDFLDKHRSDQDLKVVLNTRSFRGMTEVLTGLDPTKSEVIAKMRDLLLKAGTVDHPREKFNMEEYLSRPRTLWNDLVPDQKKKLEMFLERVYRVQDMNKLDEVVTEAMESGIMLNFRIFQDRRYNFTDCVMEKISKLKMNPKVASDIVCKLVSKGVVLCDRSGVGVMNILESKFEDHKTNMKKAYADYMNRTLRFMDVVKSATNGRVKAAEIDNSTFYLGYSRNSKIDVAKITDAARSLRLTQGSIQHGRNIIKIGKNEVEIITENGIRNYTDLADNSDVVLTFYTSQGELEVNLYPDKQDKNKIIVGVSNKKEMLEKFKNCKEAIGENCSLGGYWVYDAIEQGYFERSGKLMRSEVLSQSNGKTKESSWAEREEKRRASDSKSRGIQ